MSYWHEVKRYGEPPIRVTEKEAAIISKAWDDPSVDRVDIPRRGKIATKSISAIEPTTIRIEEKNIYLMADNALKEQKKTPKLAPDFEEHGISYPGGVITNWYKKQIGDREWESYYSKLPAYRRIDDVDKNIWVAVLLPETGEDKPKYLTPCTKQEVAQFERRT